MSDILLGFKKDRASGNAWYHRMETRKINKYHNNPLGYNGCFPFQEDKIRRHEDFIKN